MKNIRFCLVAPAISNFNRYGERENAFKSIGNIMPTMALVQLAAVAQKCNVDVTIIDGPSRNLDNSEILKEIEAVKPDVVGISAMTVSIHSAAELSVSIKSILPATKILIGGAHVSAVPLKTVELFPSFDIGIIGEGELILEKLLKTQCTDRSINGIAYRNNGKIVINERMEYIKNLDDIPFPAYDLIPNFPKDYRPYVLRYKRLPAATLITSRGCPASCVFCDRSVFGNSCRSFSAAYIVELMTMLHEKYNVQEFIIEDDTFNMYKKRVMEICESLIKKNMKVSWSCLARGSQMTEDMLLLMKKAGCWHISYGIESGNQDILKFEDKNVDLEHMRKVIDWTHKTGIFCKGFFIVGHPKETKNTIQDTIDFALNSKLDEISVFAMTVFPGSRLYEIAKDYGATENDWTRMNLLTPTFIPTGLTKDELNK